MKGLSTVFFTAFANFSNTYFVAARTKKCILKTCKHLRASACCTDVVWAVDNVTKFQLAKCYCEQPERAVVRGMLVFWF
jgi:hypothetical protein